MLRCCWLCWEVGVCTRKCSSIECCKTLYKRSIADSCSCWWILCVDCCWNGSHWCYNSLCYILCFLGCGLSWVNEGYGLWVVGYTQKQQMLELTLLAKLNREYWRMILEILLLLQIWLETMLVTVLLEELICLKASQQKLSVLWSSEGQWPQRCKIEDPSGFILFPLVVHSFDLIISSIGIFSIKGTRDPSSKSIVEDPMAVLQRGYSITILLAILTFGASTRWLLYTEQAPSAWFNFALCGLVGIITAYLFVWITTYYIDYKYQPVRTLALSSSTGHGTNIIAGISLGLESTALPVLVISVSIVSSYWLGHTSGLVDESGIPTGGLFGTAVATMGMLSTAAYVLTMDMFGPIADNAGVIVEMSQQPETVREITDILNAVGNTTKATTKGFAIGSAALASFLLFSAYMDEVAAFAQQSFKQVDIAIPEVFIGGLLGSMLIFLFSAWACAAVGRTAQEFFF
ncbi:hypothetical protein QQ045_015059 [Rhodiola kirilowii]